jgi:RHH-type proline utilization regulon transcriptional repressor/proline dehydrogenase/delta 1-pyrroline-5-carboxylate dehydrogenase
VVAGPGISVKLSALHPRYSRAQRERVLAELYPRLLALARLACDYRIGFNIDAEEAERLELSLDLVERLAAEPALAGWDGLGVVVQAYQKRAPWVIDYLAQLARLAGRRIMVRLVKGAYWDSEIKRAQVDGQAGYPVFTRKPHTDLCYLACAARLLAAADVIYPQFATHNAQTLASVEQMAAERGVADYEFQCLHGMGEPLYDNVVAPGEGGRRCRIYAPVGRHETLLPYLVRRLLENGANSSFVNRIVDETVAERAAGRTAGAGAAGRRPAPPGDPAAARPVRRRAGQLGGAGSRRRAHAGLAVRRAPAPRPGRMAGRPAAGDGGADIGPCFDVRNPADRRDRVGRVVCASPDDIDQAVRAALDAADAWAARPAPSAPGCCARRPTRWRRPRPSSSACASARPARPGPTPWPRSARRWISAATTRPVPRPAAAARAAGAGGLHQPVELPAGDLRRRGGGGAGGRQPGAGQARRADAADRRPGAAPVPRGGRPAGGAAATAGAGETVGAALVADPRVRGVIFTGSTEVARHIHRSLAARPAGRPQPRLIAETGGQNAMIVDSSALAEQVVQDVIASGFDSAGQRCSALRVLCLQDDIAGRVLGMLEAAMGELAIGNPAHLATDVGPVIDEAARAGLLAHIERMRGLGCRVFQCALPGEAEVGCFVPPTLIEIDSLAALTGEVFGPVVHVLRYAATELDALVEAINATGYGLTFGMHSRIDERIEAVSRRIRAGNMYVNRNMVGAVVGVQPFGGEGLSGTGPKAGGPLYLVHLLGLTNPPPERLGLARRPGATPCRRPSMALEAWAAARAGRRSPRRAGLTGRRACSLGSPAPGPTGETNRLFLRPAAKCCAGRATRRPCWSSWPRRWPAATRRCSMPAPGCRGCRRRWRGACSAWRRAKPAPWRRCWPPATTGGSPPSGARPPRRAGPCSR